MFLILQICLIITVNSLSHMYICSLAHFNICIQILSPKRINLKFTIAFYNNLKIVLACKFRYKNICVSGFARKKKNKNVFSYNSLEKNSLFVSVFFFFHVLRVFSCCVLFYLLVVYYFTSFCIC